MWRDRKKRAGQVKMLEIVLGEVGRRWPERVDKMKWRNLGVRGEARVAGGGGEEAGKEVVVQERRKEC